MNKMERLFSKFDIEFFVPMIITCVFLNARILISEFDFFINEVASIIFANLVALPILCFAISKRRFALWFFTLGAAFYVSSQIREGDAIDVIIAIIVSILVNVIIYCLTIKFEKRKKD